MLAWTCQLGRSKSMHTAYFVLTLVLAAMVCVFRGVERTDFYDGSKCWHLPYWLAPTLELGTRVDALGNPPAVQVKFLGDTTSIGPYGHLGQYLREIRLVRIIEVNVARPCRE